MTASADPLVLTRRDGRIARVVLNRAERLNAFAGTMRDDLRRAIAGAAENPDIRAIVIAGAGRAFCAGADIDAMEDLLRREDDASFARLVDAGIAVVRQIRRAPKPVVAAVNGVAAGAGASLALACDFRIASDTATIGMTFGRIGLHPDWGATYFLPRLVGPGRAAELIFSGRMLDSPEAARIGLFEQVVAADDFADEVDRLLNQLAAGPPLALAATKRTLSAEAEEELERALAAEREAQLRLFRSADVHEGIAGFREKRAPEFAGA